MLCAPPSSDSDFHLFSLRGSFSEGSRQNRNAKALLPQKIEDTQVFVCAPKFLAVNGWRYTCARRCSSRALMLLPTEHSPSPSPLMPQAHLRPSRRPCLLTRRQSCPIAPTRSRSRDVSPRTERPLTGRSRLPLSPRLAGLIFSIAHASRRLVQLPPCAAPVS